MCLKSMIDKNDIGNICHEHIEFYSLKSLKYPLKITVLKFLKLKKTILMVVVIEFIVEKCLMEVLN